MYLLDTNVISDAYKGAAPVVRWFSDKLDVSAYISVITLGEIETGIARKRKTDPQHADRLEAWLASTRNLYEAHTLPIDDRVAIAWGRIVAGRSRGIADGLIAATAQVHRLTLVTRNVRDFADLGLPLVDPWQVA
jgi:toxin FitB